MENFYFTFGGDHIQVVGDDRGMVMNNHWVKVTAKDYGKARGIFVTRFTLIYMKTPDSWAFQYPEKHFEREYFPAGEYMHITQDDV